MIQYYRSLILHLYGLNFISVFLEQLQRVLDMLIIADRNDQKKSAIIVVDDAGLTEANIENIRKMSEFFGIPVFIMGKEVQQKILSSRYMYGLRKYFKRETYPRGRNMGLIGAAIINAQNAHFLDLDVYPLDDADYNIFIEHTRILEDNSNGAVTGKYLSSDPGPLTVAFFKPGAHDEFQRLMTECNSGLGPIGQPMVGGIHAIKQSTYSRMVAPHIEMTVFSDDSFLAKIIEVSGKRVIDSKLEVNHKHDSTRVDYRWVFRYISERLARSIPLLPLVNGANGALSDVVRKQKNSYKSSDLIDMFESGREEALEKLELFGNGLKDLEPYARIGCRAAIKKASESIIREKEERVNEVANGLSEYISDFLPNWQKAMDNLIGSSSISWIYEKLELAA